MLAFEVPEIASIIPQAREVPKTLTPDPMPQANGKYFILPPKSNNKVLEITQDIHTETIPIVKILAPRAVIPPSANSTACIIKTVEILLS